MMEFMRKLMRLLKGEDGPPGVRKDTTVMRSDPNSERPSGEARSAPRRVPVYEAGGSAEKRAIERKTEKQDATLQRLQDAVEVISRQRR